ncbi:MAG: DUF4304 domain-containing protein [Anaerolineales bacterium]|nr:DUF4304 domain-containing protein [Anaerolineales bacterium]
MDSKDTFFACLRDEWAPLLRRSGFKGSGQRFQRDLGQVIHVIGVQVNKYGGSCCVNLGLHLRFLPFTNNQLLAPGEKIRVESCEFQWRLTPPGSTDYWWAFEQGVKAHLPPGLLDKTNTGPVEEARHLINTFETYGEPRFQTVTTVAQVSELIQVEDIERSWPVSPLYSFTPVRAGLTMARIYEYLGNRERAGMFARAGLSRVGQAKAVRTALEEFLNRIEMPDN